MRVALFGGSFDPPHRGHVALARLAIDRLHLDRVVVAPVGSQPFKHDATTGFEHRMAMLRLAFAGNPRIEISGMDAAHADGRPNYTLETILHLKHSLDPNDELFCLLGADSWLTIGKWYRATELLMACDFIVGARPGFDLAQAVAPLPKGIFATKVPSDLVGCFLFSLSNGAGHRCRLYLLPDLAEDVSASEVRAALSQGSAVDQEAVLDPEVAKYIRARKLYGVEM